MLKQLEQDKATQLITQSTLGSLPHYYTQAYDLAVQTRPLLNQTEIVLGTPEVHPILSHTAGFLEDVRMTQPGLRIVLTDPAKLDFKQLTLDRYWLMRHVAEKLAVPVDTLRSEPQIFHVHTFLHELGHADDYLNRTIIGFSLGLTDQEVANNFVNMRLQEMRQQPVRMAVPNLLKLHKSGWLGNFFEQNRAYYTRIGIGSINDLLKAQELAYVNSPMEATAHNFAADLIKNNWDLLGFTV